MSLSSWSSKAMLWMIMLSDRLTLNFTWKALQHHHRDRNQGHTDTETHTGRERGIWGGGVTMGPNPSQKCKQGEKATNHKSISMPTKSHLGTGVAVAETQLRLLQVSTSLSNQTGRKTAHAAQGLHRAGEWECPV